MKKIVFIILFLDCCFTTFYANATNLEHIQMTIPAEAQIYENSDGNIIYNILDSTSYDQIKYTLGFSASYLYDKSVIERYYLSKLGVDNFYDYLEVLIKNDSIVSYVLARKEQNDLVAKAAKEFSVTKYKIIDAVSIMTVSLGDTFLDSHVNILNLSQGFYISKFDNKYSEYVANNKKLALHADNYGKVNRIELFINDESL